MPPKPPERVRKTLSIRIDPKTLFWLNKHHVRNIGRFIDEVVTRMARRENAEHVQHSHD